MTSHFSACSPVIVYSNMNSLSLSSRHPLAIRLPFFGGPRERTLEVGPPPDDTFSIFYDQPFKSWWLDQPAWHFRTSPTLACTELGFPTTTPKSTSQMSPFKSCKASVNILLYSNLINISLKNFHALPELIPINGHTAHRVILVYQVGHNLNQSLTF